MPARYAPLPNPRTRPEDTEDELEAAFEASDEEDDSDDRVAESRPLNPGNKSSHRDSHDTDSPNASRPSHARAQSAGPGTYDFENVDYDFPPPGSPPRRDRALPNNDWGNSNGIIPSGPVAPPRSVRGLRVQGPEWVRRVLPTRVAERLTGRGERRRMVRGTDGVFANIPAKPAVPRPIREEDGIYVSPEDAQKDAPPSYASAQADAVPPYWETTIHAPSSLSPGMMIAGELPIDGLATGTLFSFLWNMLVSISFQFVGFLLTYLLHTTHAAKLGARAGLGLTLVQYGFALRTEKDEGSGYGGGSAGGDTSDGVWTGWGTDAAGGASPTPTFDTAAAAESWYASHPSATAAVDPDSAYNSGVMSDLTTEWLSFLLMTIGWFILLNSLLGFWRIKRWERSILASHQENPNLPPPVSIAPPSTQQPGPGHTRQSSFALHFERTLGLRLPNARMLRTGLGFGSGSVRGAPADGDAERYVFDAPHEHDLERAIDEERGSMEEGTGEGEADELLFEIPPDHPDRARLIAEALANERRLQQDLRAAGLL